MKGLFEMLMGRLDAYQFIAPHICLVCQKSQLLVEHLSDDPSSKDRVHSSTVVRFVEKKIQDMYQEAMQNV
jgi:hypothetical protein